jgi:hypothetical protein
MRIIRRKIVDRIIPTQLKMKLPYTSNVSGYNQVSSPASTQTHYQNVGDFKIRSIILPTTYLPQEYRNIVRKRTFSIVYNIDYDHYYQCFADIGYQISASEAHVLVDNVVKGSDTYIAGYGYSSSGSGTRTLSVTNASSIVYVGKPVDIRVRLITWTTTGSSGDVGPDVAVSGNNYMNVTFTNSLQI